jgi:UDP-N-acetylmuramoylalanine--D-glutamate ligase
MSVSSDFAQKKVLILGAGVTGLACAKSLTQRDSIITLVDDAPPQSDEFKVLSPSSVDVKDFDYVLVSPGWRESHPLIQSARQANVELINEIDLAWAIKEERFPGQKWLGLTGTNGKTTTVEMAAAAILYSNFQVSSYIGSSELSLLQ